MDKLYLMEKVKNIYESGGNIIEYLTTVGGGENRITL